MGPLTAVGPGVRLLLHHRQLVAVPIGAFQEEGRPTALQLPVGDDGDAIAQQVRFVHVVGGEEDGPSWGAEKGEVGHVGGGRTPEGTPQSAHQGERGPGTCWVPPLHPPKKGPATHLACT